VAQSVMARLKNKKLRCQACGTLDRSDRHPDPQMKAYWEVCLREGWGLVLCSSCNTLDIKTLIEKVKFRNLPKGSTKTMEGSELMVGRASALSIRSKEDGPFYKIDIHDLQGMFNKFTFTATKYGRSYYLTIKEKDEK
jgi:hypothetical protein